ncbi:MAG: hypothetical protein U1D30_02410 [Planctomycetota bacterium]
MTHREGKDGGWYLKYATDSSQDRFRGELPWENPPGLDSLVKEIASASKVHEPRCLGIHHYDIDSISVLD